uniref:NAD-dependent epimerase/dehydratase domain-containing protein n=1 Tax=Aplanochytrium stocchinoi TaxID=215587 RepID=A0A7S3LPR1_9STRA
MAGSTVLPPALVAVTGANGFIAAHVVLALLKEGYDVRAIVRDPSNEDKTGFLKEEAESMGASDRLSFAAGDLLVDGSYDPAVEGCDAVVHSAAVVNLEGNGDAEEKVVKPAISGTRNVLNSVAKVDGLKRFIQTSSIAAIYRFDEPEDYVFTENDWNTWSSIENGDAYGYGKSVSEKLVWEEKEKGNLGDCQVVSINPWVVIGPILSKSHVNSSAAVLAPVITYDKLVNFEAGWVDVREVAQAHGKFQH